MNGCLWVPGRHSVPKPHMVTEFLTIPLIRRTFPALLLISCTKAAFTNWRIILLVAEPPTCHQGALCWALLHEHHVLKQRAVCRVPACSCPGLGQVGSQMAAGEKRWAEGERWLQAGIRLRWGHLEKSRKTVQSTKRRWRGAAVVLTLDAAVAVAVAGNPKVMLGKDGEV